MAAYTTSQEIKFGYRVDERTLGAIIGDADSNLMIELKITDGKYAKLQIWTFTGSVGPNSAHHGITLNTRGTTYRFTVTGSVDWFVDESRLT